MARHTIKTDVTIKAVKPMATVYTCWSNRMVPNGGDLITLLVAQKKNPFCRRLP